MYTSYFKMDPFWCLDLNETKRTILSEIGALVDKISPISYLYSESEPEGQVSDEWDLELEKEDDSEERMKLTYMKW